jgi:hypothetical protein
MALPSAAELLAVQMRHAWVNTAWALEGMTNEEYFWEPTPGAWTVRPRGAQLRGFGKGEFICEDMWPPPDPLPVTTIAWRVIHLAAWNDIYVDWTFGDARLTLADLDVPGDRAGGVAWIEAAQERFATAVEALSDDEAFAYRPAHWGEDLPIARLVTSMINENVHHVAEIGVLRDLRRGRARSQPESPPAGPDWWQPRPR